MKIDGVTSPSGKDRWAVYADYRRSLQEGTPDSADIGDATQAADPKRIKGSEDCLSCKSRRYQDGSNDPGVSFKTPTALSPDQAASAVRSHEMEHVSHETSKAARENRQVISQSVTYHNAVCSECGTVYVSGGTTRTVTKAKEEPSQGQQTQASPQAPRQGGLDVTV